MFNASARGAAESSKAGLVIAAHGRRGMLLAPESGVRLPYLTPGRDLTVCCGDRVRYALTDGDRVALIRSIEARTSELARRAPRGARAEVLAVNFTHLGVVLAARPEPDLYLVDRYLCAAVLARASAAIVWNKADEAGPPADALAAYARLGIPVVPTSGTTGHGVTAIPAWLAGGTVVLVGQSGVGKSTLVNALVPDAARLTAAISTATAEGRHTTTASTLLDLPGGGHLIDTPGVRDFVPAIRNLREVAAGFVEIADAGEHCRFADCGHLREDDCAVQAAVGTGQINARRYESYRRLMNLAGRALARSGPSRG
jgi:ribosome biogenesis GTPase